MDEGAETYPQLLQTVLDCTDPRQLAEFYRELLGLVYRAGDEPAAFGPGDPAPDWLVLLTRTGQRSLAFQQVDRLERTTWPAPDVPQQLHLDLTVPSREDLDVQHERALGFGARLVLDRSDDPQEPLRVYADPAGHTFCLFVA
ncbi:MAG: VOC family protein [Kineosporiaceae bacterium]|nr:VOC family protein [Kineosporiaceae bacterium]MBK7622734.1 VOC family protein [Kineosporiaceae bacterium]MBK8078710.1 VOC family protein [Kineosporiaceae bacterium]